MKKTLKKTKKIKIKVTLPKEAPKVLTEKKELEREIEIVSALDALSISEGGIVLQDGLVADIIRCVETLIAKYKTAAHIELIATIADMKTKIDVLHVITRAKSNKDFLREQIEADLKT